MISKVFPFAALVVAVLIFFFYVQTTWYGSIATTQTAITADDSALAAATAYTEREKELQRQKNDISPDNLARLNKFLPDSIDNVQIILDLNALAARSGMALASIDVAAPAAPDGPGSTGRTDPVGSTDITLSAAGSYAALEQFLTGVEASARVLDVTDVSVRGSDTGIYTYQLKLRVYWLR